MPFTNPTPPPEGGSPRNNPLTQPSTTPFSVGGQPMEQGQTYEPGEILDGSEESSAAQDIEEILSEEETKKRPINIQLIIAAGCGVILVIIFIIVIIGVSKSTSKGEETSYQYELSSSDEVYSPTDNTQWWDENPEDTAESPQKWTLPTEDSEALRAAGYTSAEIEEIESREVEDIKPYIEKAALAKQKFLLEQYHFLQERMAAGIDEETSYIFNNSIFSLPAQELGEAELDSWEQEVPAIRETKRENVNYTKLPLLGNQCLLKLELHDGTITFFYIQPERYASLDKESGNIVIKYTEVFWRDCRFIVNIEEMPI